MYRWRPIAVSCRTVSSLCPQQRSRLSCASCNGLGRLVNDGIDVTAPAEARTHLADLDATLTPIYHRYLTYVIEDHLARKLELPTHLAVVDALLPLPSITDGPSLAEDIRYRRWLVGDTARACQRPRQRGSSNVSTCAARRSTQTQM